MPRLNTVATGNISRGVLLNGANGTLNMGADLVLTEDLDIRGSIGFPAIVQANGNDIMARDILIGRFGNPGDITNDGAIVANRNLEVSGGTFTLDADDSVASTVLATNGGTLNLHVNTAAVEAQVTSGGTLNTVATSNVSSSALVTGVSSTLSLGAAFVLTGDLDIRGDVANVATVQAGGNDISARDVFVGRFGSRGALLDSGLLTVARTLSVDNSNVTLDGGFDTVGDRISVFTNSTLEVNQDADGVRGLSLEGPTLDILDTSVLALTFDNPVNNVADWVFRWAGDRVADINALIGTGRITINSPHPFFVVDNGDGYTYIANFQADFNGDTRLDCIDIDMMTAAVASGSTDLTFDLTGDGAVTIADRDAWLAGAGAAFLPSGNSYLLGDANLDGLVDGQDFLIWNQNKFTGIAAWCSGDFTADGIVDGQDFLLWNLNKFQSADAAALGAQVPEPAGMTVLLFLLLGLASGLREVDA